MKKILVAEDNLANSELIRELLEIGGYEVVLAEDGGRAMEVLPETKPDILLLDIQMPVLDGYQVMRRLRNDPAWRDLPILALTAYAMRGDMEKALAAGFDGYITKPIDHKQLLQEIERLVRQPPAPSDREPATVRGAAPLPRKSKTG